MHLFHHQATRQAHPATRHCRADMSDIHPILRPDLQSHVLLISCAQSGIAAFSWLYMYVGQYSGQVPLLKHIQLLMAETENNKNIEASPV